MQLFVVVPDGSSSVVEIASDATVGAPVAAPDARRPDGFSPLTLVPAAPPIPDTAT